MAALEQLGGETWFRLGDGDLATHVERTRRLQAGEPLSESPSDLCERLGIAARILPMMRRPRRARVVVTAEGVLAFQDYFVRRRARPSLRFSLRRRQAATPPRGDVLAALADPAARASSSPVEPMAQHRSRSWRCRQSARALARRARAGVAVSPIVGGARVKGPTAKIMAELGGR